MNGAEKVMSLNPIKIEWCCKLYVSNVIYATISHRKGGKEKVYWHHCSFYEALWRWQINFKISEKHKYSACLQELKNQHPEQIIGACALWERGRRGCKQGSCKSEQKGKRWGADGKKKERAPGRTGRLSPVSWMKLHEDEMKKIVKQKWCSGGIRTESGMARQGLNIRIIVQKVPTTEQTVVHAHIYVLTCLYFWRNGLDCLFLSWLI